MVQSVYVQYKGSCTRRTDQSRGSYFGRKHQREDILKIHFVHLDFSIKGNIVSTLRMCLHNDDLTLTLRVAEKKEYKILTRKEQYQVMAEKNPAIERLRRVFDLELA